MQQDAQRVSWEPPSERVRELIREGARIVLDPPAAWLEELDAATLSGPQRSQIAEDPVLAAATRRANRSNLLAWASANVRRPGERVVANADEVPVAIARDLVRRGLNESALDSYRAGQNVALRRWIQICLSLTTDPDQLRELLDVSCRSISDFVDDTIASLTEVIRLGGRQTAAVVWCDEPREDLAALDRAVELIGTCAGDTRPLSVLASAATRWVWVHGGPDPARLREAVAADPQVRIAVGSTGEGLDGFRRSHLDALTVQRMLARLASPQQLATHDEVELVALLTADLDRADQFVHRVLGDLAGASPELTESVRGYIAEQCNVSRAAQRLYIHRNTLLRRLAQADRLLPRPLARDVVAVGTALEVLRWRGVAPEDGSAFLGSSYARGSSHVVG